MHGFLYLYFILYRTRRTSYAFFLTRKAFYTLKIPDAYKVSRKEGKGSYFNKLV